MKQTTNERTKKQSTSIHISNPIPSLPKLSILRTPSLSFHQKTDDISLKISLKKNYDTSKDQTIKSSREIPAFSSSKEKPIISYRESQLDNSKSQRVSTPELKRNLKILSENEWKTNERSRIKENMRDKSILSALEKSQFQEKPQQKSIEMQQHNISKFYLEYNNSHHPNRPKFLTKNEISDLLGVKTFKLNKDDLQIKEILDNYPNSSFLDLTQLKILDKERNSAGIPNNLTSKFKRLLLKDKESLKTPSMFSSLLETQHKAQNNPEKHPNIRQGVYEMALFLDKISAEIYEKSEERQSPDLDGQIFSIQQACRICIQSLANDISQECNERGILLAKVWDLNMDLMNSYLKKMEKFSTEAEKSFTRNIQSIKQAYKDKLISLEEEIEGLKKKLIKNESNIKETYEDCSFYKEKVIYSERVRKLMESEFQELRSNYENIFLENLKYKLNQSEELNFHRDEKEIFKRTLEEMTRTQVIRKKKGSYISVQQPKLSKAEGLLRKMTSGELNPIALEETTAEFIMQMTNLSYNILDFPKNYEDYISVDYHNPKEIKEISSFFMKEVSVDTTGLHYKEDKEISTKELERSRVREIETQTVLIDEIGEEGIIQKTWSDSMLGSETLYQKKLNPNMNHPLNLSVNTLIRDSPDHHSTIRKRMFTFNQETLQTLEKFSEMNSLTVAKILEFYSNEMQNFYNLILNITDIFINGSPGKLNESRDVDWFATYESILNNKSIHEQFIKLIYERDKKKMNELLSQKIELIQKKFDFQGVEKNYESLEEKYKRISKKFDEFFAFILQEEAEKMLEAQEKDSLNINNNIVLISDKLKTKKKTQFTDNIDYDRLGALQSIRGSSHKKSQLIEKAEFFLEKSAQRRKLSFTETFNNNNPLEIQKNSDNFSNKEERLKELAERKALWLNETYKYLPANKTSIKVQSPHYQNCSLFLLKTRIFIEKNTKLLMEKNIGGISLISLIRTISPLFVEFLKRITKLPPDNLTLNPLFFIFYEYMYNRHSLSKENTETRILKIIQSSFFFKGIARIRNFLRLLGVLGNEKMDGSDLIFYLDCMKQLDDMIIGTFNHDNLLEKTGTIPGITLLLNIKESVSIGLSRAIEIVTKYFKSTLSYEIYKLKLEDMINKLKSIKTPDPLISRKYVVDVDFTIELMFWIRDESRIKFQKVFNALDLEGKDALNQNEFLLLLRNVENYRSTFEELKENFRNEADCIDEEKIDCIGFKKFASVCEKNKWLLQKNLQKFEREVKDEISQIEILNKEWDVKKNLIKLKFIKTNSYNIFYHKVLKIIDECILSRSNGGNKKDDGRMWLLYRLIDDESNMILIDFESEIVLAKELREIKEIFESIHIRKN